MPDESIVTSTVKTASDGTVKIAVEKYNDLIELIASQKGSIERLTTLLNKAQSEPPVINRTVVQKTAEMVAQDHKAWGWTFIGAGATAIGIGAIRVRLGRIKS